MIRVRFILHVFAINPGEFGGASTADWQKGHKTRLKLAFVCTNIFLYGGLQRDFLRIARECQALGHDIRVLLSSGTVIPGFRRYLGSCGGANEPQPL